MLFIAGFIILMTSFRRTRLGVGGTQGESMLVDLRDRIQSQGGIPDLPDGWHLESALRSAGGTPFAGDFIVTVRTDDRLDVVVVDVSGKGEGAGTRALLLSGAFGGLLGRAAARRVPARRQRLPAPPELGRGLRHRGPPLARRRTGEFAVRTAGHPPAAQRGAGSGRWTVHSTDGPALGLIEGTEFPCTRGHAAPAATRSCSTPTGWSRRPAATSCSASTGCWARPSSCSAASSRAAPSRMIDALGSPHDDRALLLLHRV